MNDRAYKRYPGTRPFQDTDMDRLVFKGREDDLDRFLHLVLAERLVVLFSKSGMGKTSLLNAGLSRPLRERKFVPVPIRLNEPGVPFMDAIDAQVRHVAAEKKIEFVAGDTSSLWKYFKTAEFWGEGDLLLTPVLMFDQFEEFFSLDYSQQQHTEFFRQLAELVYGQQPDKEKHDRGSVRSRRLAESLPNVKIVLSLREDYLANLEEIDADIPSIFRNRYRLRSLSPERAQRAITEPAAIEHSALASRTFAFGPKAVDLMLNFLQQGGSRTEESPAGAKGFLPWALIGMGIILFSYFFNPVIGTSAFGGKTIFLRQPGVLSATIAFSSLVLAYFFPMKPLFTVLTALGFQLFSLFRYWSAVGFSDVTVDAKIAMTGLLGAAAAGWIAWLRLRQVASIPREVKPQRKAEIEPFQIQLLCQHIEESVLRRQHDSGAGAPVTITEKDLGGEEGMQNVLQGFYRQQMKRLPPGKWWVAHKLCERGLISGSGRRLSLDGEFIADRYNVSGTLLDDLIEKHLLRAESRLGSHYYELSHDSLVKPIHETAIQRLRKTRIVLLLAICGTLLFFVGKDLMEKASAAQQLVAARNTLDEAMQIGGTTDSMRTLLRSLDSILQQQAGVLGLDSLQTGSLPPRPSPVNGGGEKPPPAMTAAITGRIVDAKTGMEVMGAAVVLLGPTSDSTRSDEKGNFSIGGLDAGRYSMNVTRDGYKNFVRSDIDIHNADENVGAVKLEAAVVTPPPPSTGRIFGRVVDADDDPVEKASIVLEGSSRKATSGGDGKFALENVPFGTYRLRVSGHEYRERNPETITLNSAQKSLGDLRLMQSSSRPVLQNPQAVAATYPREALSLRVNGKPVSGTVRLKIFTNAGGEVVRVKVLDSVNPLLDSAAVAAARKGIYSGSGYVKTTYPFKHPEGER